MTQVQHLEMKRGPCQFTRLGISSLGWAMKAEYILLVYDLRVFFEFVSGFLERQRGLTEVRVSYFGWVVSSEASHSLS